MLQVLQTEIDIEPNRPHQLPVKVGQVGIGCTLIRIKNDTERVNRYTIDLKCNDPYWPDNNARPWHKFKSLSPVQGNGQNVAPVAPDIPGPLSKSLTIHLAPGETRDILLSFRVPPDEHLSISEVRSKVYALKICIFTSIHNGGAADLKKVKPDELDVIAIVRPSYDWSFDIKPVGRRLGRVRRSAELEVEVINRSNDWLYCELRVTPQPQLHLNAWVQRIAIRPPEPGEIKVSRTVPLRALTQLKEFRGSRVEQALPLEVTRLHAPSVSPLPDAARQGEVSGANSADAVRVSDPNDSRPLPARAALIYCPPIPKSLADFILNLPAMLRGGIATLFALVLAVHLIVLGYEHWQNDFNAVTISAAPRSALNKPLELEIRGNNIAPSQVFFGTEKKLLLVPGPDHSFHVTLPDTYNQKPAIRVRLERYIWWLPWLGPLLPETGVKTVQLNQDSGRI